MARDIAIEIDGKAYKVPSSTAIMLEELAFGKHSFSYKAGDLNVVNKSKLSRETDFFEYGGI